MVQKGKINVKERFSDGEVDLSMSDLDEVPVKEIAALKKTTSLDLSNNRLTLLPVNFTVLTNLTKLDLSKNELTELPEDFGSLHKLRYLDLYKNNLERLPLSFGQLGGLKFLDLKDNPLIPAIAKVAGPCLDTKGCQQCARDVVLFYKKLQEEVDNEVEMRKKARQKQLEVNQQKKQEDKKKQKKEKHNNKVKKDAIQNDYVDAVSVTKKQIKKEQKKNKYTQKKNERGTIGVMFYSAFWLMMFSFLMMWYHYTYRPTTFEKLIGFTTNCYRTFLEKLPPNGQYYVESFMVWSDNVLSLLGEHTKNLITKCIEFVNNNETVQHGIVKVKECFSSLLERWSNKS